MTMQKQAELLAPVNNLKSVFRDIRNYLAGNSSGITRDEEIVQNVIRLLFCKIYDETANKGMFTSCGGTGDCVKDRISELFHDVKSEFEGTFSPRERLELGSDDLIYVVSRLEGFSLLDSDRDVISDAFEEFIGTSFRGSQGQFFTPKNVVKMIVDVLQPSSGESILDPACGSGGFLSHALQHALKSGQKDFSIVGIDKDSFLSRVANTYLSLIGKDLSGVFCENSLDIPDSWGTEARKGAKLSSFDIVMTNPPFGAKIPITDKNLLRQYSLGHEWAKYMGDWKQSSQVAERQSPQVLFIERCLQFLRKGGRMAIVLPDGIFGNPSDRYIWEYITDTATVTGVVSLSQETFQPSTHTKTSVLFLEKRKTAKPIFMAIAKSIGHNKNGKEVYKINPDGSFVFDKRGNRIIDDEIPDIASGFIRHNRANGKPAVNRSRLGFTVPRAEIRNNIYIPENYDPSVFAKLEDLRKAGDCDLVSIGSLVSEGALQIKRGNEIGSQFYGTGDVPFVRTSDIVNWEIKFDPVKSVSEDVYNQYRFAQDVRENDILIVSDGTFLIGRTALVTKSDLRIIIQSHLRKIRVMKESAFLNSFYLLYLLNTSLVQQQIKTKTFTQATISTIGNRIGELILPVSRDWNEIDEITKKVKWIIRQREKTKRELAELLGREA